MKAMGFQAVACGPDGPDAWRSAQDWNERWQRARRGTEPPPKHVWPRGSLGEAFERFRRTEIWKAKKPRTREDWERGWKHIAPIFADVAPHTVTLEDVDGWYAALKDAAGVREAHRAVKIWRALWQVAGAMHYCEPDHDPTFGIRRETPQGRWQRWDEGEVVRLVKGAIRAAHLSLACVIAVAYDTGLSPVDVRSLTFADSRRDRRGIWFDLARAKTGRAAVGTLSRRTERLLLAYVATLPDDQLPSAPIFRTMRGRAFTKNSLSEDFRDLRTVTFPGDTRKLMDLRRSGAVEAVAGGVSDSALSAKMANTIADSKELQRTYLPVDRAAVDLADEARLRGRRRILANKSGSKVEFLRPGKLNTASEGGAK
jgi:integrase